MLSNPNPNFNQDDAHSDAVNIDGLEDLFRWTSATATPTADEQDNRVKRSREQRIRKQVLEFIQKASEDKAIRQAMDEVTDLQNRVITLLQSCNELALENSVLKQIMVAQFTAIQSIPSLEQQIEDLKINGLDQETIEDERREMLNALSKMKKDRDFLEDLLSVSENENNRLVGLLIEAKTDLDQIKSRKWWHFFKRTK